MKKWRAVLLIILALVILASTFQPTHTVYAADPSGWTNEQIDDHLQSKGIPKYIRKDGRMYFVNYGFIRTRKLLVYGTPWDVSNNDRKGSEYRYLGYTESGTIYNNIHFPEDAAGNNNVGTRNWIYQPWTNPTAIRNATKPYITDWMNSYIIPVSTQISWLDTVLDKYQGDGSTRGNWLPKYPGSVLLNYAVIEQPPTDYGPGTVTLWHRQPDKDWYDSFVMPPLKDLFDETEPPPDGPPDVVCEPCQNPRSRSATGITGTYYYYVGKVRHVGYYYERLSIEIVDLTVGRSQERTHRIVRGQGYSFLVKTHYHDDSGKYHGPEKVYINLPIMEPLADGTWEQRIERIQLEAVQGRPGDDEIVWALPYGYLDEYGNWYLDPEDYEPTEDYPDPVPAGRKGWIHYRQPPGGLAFSVETGPTGKNGLRVSDCESLCVEDHHLFDGDYQWRTRRVHAFDMAEQADQGVGDGDYWTVERKEDTFAPMIDWQYQRDRIHPEHVNEDGTFDDADFANDWYDLVIKFGPFAPDWTSVHAFHTALDGYRKLEPYTWPDDAFDTTFPDSGEILWSNLHDPVRDMLDGKQDPREYVPPEHWDFLNENGG